MKPTINRQVHYVARGSADGVFPSVCRTAIVTEVGLNNAVGLFVINPTGTFHHPLAIGGGISWHDGVQVEEGPQALGALCNNGDRRYPPGTWHWAELVAE